MTSLSRWYALFTGLLAVLAVAQTARADLEPSYREVAGMIVYVGLMPAEIVRGHPQEHAEGSMHGGSPDGPHDYHLVAALFDTTTGARVEDAEIRVSIEGLGHVGQSSVKLEPMSIAGTITYGNFVSLPGSDRYQFKLEIRRPGLKSAAEAEFTLRHGAQ